MNFEDVLWHDGLLLSINISFSEVNKSIVTLKVNVLANYDRGDRINLSVSFFDAEKIINILDFLEMADNYSAGNIENGFIKAKSVYRVKLVDGYFEITAGSVVVTILD
jgi:hypothetical protein